MSISVSRRLNILHGRINFKIMTHRSISNALQPVIYDMIAS